MRKIVAAILCAISIPAIASPDEIVQVASARVVSVDPITVNAYNTVPRTTCTRVEQRDTTPAEGVAGTIVGNNATKTKEQCSTYYEREAFVKIVAYNVSFEYGGKIRTTRLKYDPGNFITIKSVTRIYAME